jgi:hypothetical protein
MGVVVLKRLGLIRDPLEGHIVYPFNLSIARNDNAHPWIGRRSFDWDGWAAGVDEVMRRVDEIRRRELRGWKL